MFLVSRILQVTCLIRMVIAGRKTGPFYMVCGLWTSELTLDVDSARVG